MNQKTIHNRPIVHTYKSHTYHIDTVPFTESEPIIDIFNIGGPIYNNKLKSGLLAPNYWNSNKIMLVIGDEQYNENNLQKYSIDQLINIFKKATALNLTNMDELLQFVCEYGLPISDCSEHISSLSTETIFNKYFIKTPVIPDYIQAKDNTTLNFCDMFPYYKLHRSLLILQIMTKLKNNIDTISGDNKKDIIDITKGKLFITLIQLLLTYRIEVFHTNIAEHNYNSSSTLSFINQVCGSVTKNKNIDIKTLKNSLLCGKYIEPKSKRVLGVKIMPELNNTHCFKLFELLLYALEIAKANNTPIVNYFFYPEIENNHHRNIYLNYSKIDYLTKYKPNDFWRMIVDTATLCYYNLLSDIMQECSIHTKVASHTELDYSPRIPSMIHGLFYLLYNNPDDPIKICKLCGGSFFKSSRRSDALYCTDACANNARQIKHRNAKHKK